MKIGQASKFRSPAFFHFGAPVNISITNPNDSILNGIKS